MTPRDAPRCLCCGIALPAHARGCPVATPADATVDVTPLRELPAREPYEVTQRSRFEGES